MNAPMPFTLLRFAPSPHGRLHLGHALSALLNERAAAALGATLLLRIEDYDPTRSREQWVTGILDDLAWLGVRFAPAPLRQSTRTPAYEAAAARLREAGLLYPCFCSRADLAAAAGPDSPRDPDGGPLYPGTCRHLSAKEREKRFACGAPHAWRLHMERAAGDAPHVMWREADGPEFSRMHDEVFDVRRWGDVVLVRKDAPASYFLASTVDDAVQRITHVVRGRDLFAQTAVQALLRRLLGLENAPVHHHHALLLGPDGTKLAKSLGSKSLADWRAEGMSAAAVRAMALDGR